MAPSAQHQHEETCLLPASVRSMGYAGVGTRGWRLGSLRSMGDAECRVGGGWKPPFHGGRGMAGGWRLEASVPWASLVSPPRDSGGRGFVRKWGSVAVTGELGMTPLRISNTEEERQVNIKNRKNYFVPSAASLPERRFLSFSILNTKRS